MLILLNVPVDNGARDDFRFRGGKVRPFKPSPFNSGVKKYYDYALPALPTASGNKTARGAQGTCHFPLHQLTVKT